MFVTTTKTLKLALNSAFITNIKFSNGTLAYYIVMKGRRLFHQLFLTSYLVK